MSNLWRHFCLLQVPFATIVPFVLIVLLRQNNAIIFRIIYIRDDHDDQESFDTSNQAFSQQRSPPVRGSPSGTCFLQMLRRNCQMKTMTPFRDFFWILHTTPAVAAAVNAVVTAPTFGYCYLRDTEGRQLATSRPSCPVRQPLKQLATVVVGPSSPYTHPVL